MKVYLIISIDTECDKGPGWMIQEPMQFSSVTKGVPDLLSPLFEEFDLKPTYLLSPEIIQDEESVITLKKLSNAELGTHLHGEFIEPDADFNAKRTRTPQLQYSKDIEFAKLQNLTELFKQQLEFPPTSFRAGRWGISNYTLRILEDLGYTVDSSVCSFRTHYFDHGKSVNFWGAPTQPYHPSYSSFRKKGKMKILEVPATTGNADLLKFSPWMLRMLSDSTHFYKRVFKKLGVETKVKWLRPHRSDSEKMLELARAYIDRFGGVKRPVFLNMMFHSNEIIPGGSPYVQTQYELDAYIGSMRMFFKIMKENYELEGVGLSDVPGILA